VIDCSAQVEFQRPAFLPVQDRLPVLGDVFQGLLMKLEGCFVILFIQPTTYRFSDNLGDAGSFSAGNFSEFVMMFGL
jgi:hypothetical protein